MVPCTTGHTTVFEPDLKDIEIIILVDLLNFCFKAVLIIFPHSRLKPSDLTEPMIGSRDLLRHWLRTRRPVQQDFQIMRDAVRIVEGLVGEELVDGIHDDLLLLIRDIDRANPPLGNGMGLLPIGVSIVLMEILVDGNRRAVRADLEQAVSMCQHIPLEALDEVQTQVVRDDGVDPNTGILTQNRSRSHR